MRLRPICLSLGLAFLSPAYAVPEDGTDTLLRSARMWDAKNRTDLSRQMLEKYLLARPDALDALLMLGEIELRSGNIEIAQQLLQRLRRQHPDAPQTRDLGLLYRIWTQDKQSMAKVRLLARAGRTEEAVAQLRQLFPKGPPPGELAIEYYRIIDDQPQGIAEARRGLEQLRRQYPGDSRYELALASLVAQQPAGQRTAIQTFTRLARQGDAPRQQLVDAWRSALYKLPEDGSAIAPLREFLLFAPEETAMADRLANAQRAQEAHRRLLADPAYQARMRGLDELQKGDIAAAETALLRALESRPRDPEVLGGLGLVRLRQGLHEEARGWFLKASQAEPDSSRWPSLASTAVFWGKLKIADAQLEAGQLEAAEQSVRAALAQQPDNPEGLAALAGIHLAANQIQAAEQGYRHVLRLESTNASAVRGLTRLLIKENRREEALALLAAQQELLAPADRGQYAELQASLLRDEADAYLAARRTSQALQSLELALLLAPREAWARYDLARLYSQLNLPQLGERIMAEGASLAPDDINLAYAQALYLNGLGQAEHALTALARIPAAASTPSIQALAQRATLDYRLDQVRILTNQGKTDEARRLMGIAEQDAGQRPEAVSQVAHAWIDLNQNLRAQELMQALADTLPDDKAVQLLQASILNRSKADTALAALMPRLQEKADWNPADLERLLDLETDLLSRQIEQLLAAGRQNQAQQLATAPLSIQADESLLTRARARLLMEARHYQAALPLLKQLRQTFPSDTDIPLDLARSQAETGDAAAALLTLNELQRQLGPADLDQRLAILRQLLRMDRLLEARELSTALLAHDPENTEILLGAGRVERADRRYAQALDYFRQARRIELAAKPETATAPLGQIALLEKQLERYQETRTEPPLRLAYALNSRDTASDISPRMAPEPDPTTPPQGLSYQLASPPKTASPYILAAYRSDAAAPLLPSIAEQEIKSIEARRQNRVEIGFDQYLKNSTPGTSSMNGQEIPLVGWLALDYDGHLFVQADRVKLDAGELPGNFDDAALFGKVQAYNYRSNGDLPQTATGTNLAVGYVGDDLRLDLGVIGQGFPVRNIVGGLSQSWDLGNFSTRLEISRRPVTSSLLSYAGTRDPVTGAIWGGVVATGIGGRIAADLGAYSTFASLSLAKLTGKNVLDNERLILRTGIDRDVFRSEDMRVNLGLVFSYWNYSENQSYYTFGHGGYYSPQSYAALALPVDWAGRSGRLSYHLKGSISVSNSREKSMDFYPADAALQARATTSLLPNGYDEPRYEGSSGAGFGYALQAAAEYRLTPNLAVGGRFGADRSAYYSPNNLLFYLRYRFEPQTGPVPFPPTPVKPYSQF